MTHQSWSRHRHWHDERGRTHKQGPHTPLWAASLISTEPIKTRCWNCGAELSAEAEQCPECRREVVPF